MKPPTRTISVRDVELTVRELGSGPPLLFAHSLTFDHRMWLGAAEALATEHRVILLDLHGHGTSSAPDRVYSLEDMADDVDSVLEQLGVERVCYVGHSMGGMVGLRLALRHPERVGALVLCNTSARAEVEGARDLFHHINESSRGKPPNTDTVGFILQLMFSPEFAAENRVAVAPFEEILFNAPNPEGAYRTGHAVIWRTCVEEDLQRIEVPTLVISSAADSAITADVTESIASGISTAEHVALAGGHLSPIEQAEPFLNALRSFLARAWTAGVTA